MPDRVGVRERRGPGQSSGPGPRLRPWLRGHLRSNGAAGIRGTCKDCGLRTPSWVQSESVRAISVQRVIRQLGSARAETATEVRNRVINFLRDW
jgi:hypothetical protein